MPRRTVSTAITSRHGRDISNGEDRETARWLLHTNDGVIDYILGLGNNNNYTRIDKTQKTDSVIEN